MGYPSAGIEKQIERHDKRKREAMRAALKANTDKGDSSMPNNFSPNPSNPKNAPKLKKVKSKKRKVKTEIDNHPMNYSTMSNEEMYPESEQARKKK